MKDRKYDLEDRFIDFAVLIISLIEALPNSRAGNHIAGQLIRSGTSPASNYGEAQGAELRKDFIHKMKIVVKELNESRVWLKIVRRKKLIEEATSKNILQECDELIKIVAKSIITASDGIK